MAQEPTRAATPRSPAGQANRARRDRRQPGPAFAAIDLGTNNCRMLVARRAPGGFRIIDSFSRIVRLGEGLNDSGALSEAAMVRVVEALSVCAEKMEKRSVVKSRCVATQACRMADNGPELMARIKEKTGLDFDIITSEEEARLSVLGCLDLMDESYETALVVDIGGGSTELSWVDVGMWRERGGYASGGRPPVRTWASAPVGVVTLSERFPETPDTAAWYGEMRSFAAAMLKTPKGAKKLRKHFKDGRAHLIGTSGTITSVAGVHLDLPRYERAKVDGIWMSADDTIATCNRLSAKDFAGRSQEPVIGIERADLVLAGCAILEAVMQAWPATQLRVGDRGLREGLLMNLMRKPKRRRGRRKGSAPETSQ